MYYFMEFFESMEIQKTTVIIEKLITMSYDLISMGDD